MRTILSVLLLLAFGTLGCSREQEASASPDTFLHLRIAEVSLNAQVALSQQEQRKGLMHRESLPEDSGMLFAYPSPRRLAFWMANTPIPLDIGFFDNEGRLLEVHRLIPFDTTQTVSQSDNVQFALEMETGWFASKGLFPGAKMDLALLRKALRQRGADPERFGL